MVSKTVLEEDSFEAAVKRLNETKLIASMYYIVSGLNPNEGVVIERDRTFINGFYSINESNWYLVQTNYDRNQTEPWDDKRRHPAE